MDVFAEIYKKSYPLIEQYENDLIVHDKQWISDNPKIPFIHYTRKWGTHLISFNPAVDYPIKGVSVPYMFGRADREFLLKSKMTSAMYFDNNPEILLIQYFDGINIRTIKKPTALKYVKLYMAEINRKFE